MKNTTWAWMVGSVLTLGRSALGAVIGSSNYLVQTYYANPHAGETLVSFDWDANTNLYYSTGRPDYDLGLSVYRWNGTAVSNLYTDATAFSGSRVTAIGGRIYFNDGGTYARWTCDYYRYDPARPAAPTNLGVLSDIYGLETRNGTDFWAAGGYNAAIYYSPLTPQGDLAGNPLANLGVIGAASGPIAFDTNGNLYYAEGYVAAGTPTVYRWSAAEVAAALANPGSAPLQPDGHEWVALSAGDGASSLAVDGQGHVLVTATSFINPSELQRLFVDQGRCAGYEVLARSDARLETVRVRESAIYVSASDGIFTVSPIQPDIRSPQDYNGDGKSDLAVFHNGAWSIFLMGENQVLQGPFGHPDATPLAADFDGNGQADPAVFHNGAWSIFLMGENQVLQGPFGHPDGVPVK